MKTNIFLFILFSFLIVGRLNSEDLIPFSFNGMYGYVNEKINIVIPPQYEKAGHFSREGYAVVRFKSNFSGIINRYGAIILTADTNIIYHVAKDLYFYTLTYKNENTLFRAHDKKVISKELWAEEFASEDGYFLAVISEADDNRYVFIDHNAQIVLENLRIKRPSYSFFENRAVVTNEDWKPIIIDTDGNIVGNNKFIRLGQRYSEGLLPAQTDKGITGYVNTSGNFAFEIPFISTPDLEATNFSEGFAIIRINRNPSAWKIINKNGEIISGDISASSANDFSNGYSLIITFNPQANKYFYGYINTQGEYFQKPILEEADAFYNRFARIKYKGREGLLKTNGKVIWSDEIISNHPIERNITEENE
jgi:hypothetical protein